MNDLKLNDTIAYQDASGIVHFGQVVGPFVWDAARKDWFVPISIKVAAGISRTAPLRIERATVPASTVEAWPRSRAMRDQVRYTARVEAEHAHAA